MSAEQEQDEMSARNQDNEQADDVATLYSWANLHGAKYRDFSASRQQMRAQMRQRMLADKAQAAREEAQREAVEQAEPMPSWEDLLSVETVPVQAARAESNGNGHTEIAAAESGNGAGRNGNHTELSRAESRYAELATEHDNIPVHPAWLAEKPVAPPPPVQSPQVQGSEKEQAQSQTQIQAQGNETLQQSRERVASRWFALQGILGRRQEESRPERSEGQVPALAVFSLAGGVGKTSLVASLGRALAARGERVLLADTCSFGLLPFYFGAREVKPGVLRTFSGGVSDPPIRMLTLDTEQESGDQDLLRREIARVAQDAGRILIDVATGSAAMLRQALRLSSTVLVPLVPDMASVVTLQALEAFFRNQEAAGGKPVQPVYVLNQFDPLLPLHLDVREVLRQQMGERLLPFAIRRSTAVSEALAEGMTVMDYAPTSPAAEDMMNLVTWIRNTSVAVAGGHRGARWSER